MYALSSDKIKIMYTFVVLKTHHSVLKFYKYLNSFRFYVKMIEN